METHLRLAAGEQARRERQPNWGAGRRYTQLVAEGMPKLTAAKIALSEVEQRRRAEAS